MKGIQDVSSGTSSCTLTMSALILKYAPGMKAQSGSVALATRLNVLYDSFTGCTTIIVLRSWRCQFTTSCGRNIVATGCSSWVFMGEWDVSWNFWRCWSFHSTTTAPPEYHLLFSLSFRVRVLTFICSLDFFQVFNRRLDKLHMNTHV